MSIHILPTSNSLILLMGTPFSGKTEFALHLENNLRTRPILLNTSTDYDGTVTPSTYPNLVWSNSQMIKRIREFYRSCTSWVNPPVVHDYITLDQTSRLLVYQEINHLKPEDVSIDICYMHSSKDECITRLRNTPAAHNPMSPKLAYLNQIFSNPHLTHGALLGSLIKDRKEKYIRGIYVVEQANRFLEEKYKVSKISHLVE